MSTAASPAASARARGVTELLHFTTNRGLIGILSTGKVYSRDGLNSDQYLENVKILNSPDRSRDADWTGWVNLSVSRVNNSFMGSSKNWHSEDDIWWSCLSFDIEILDDPDVWFCTGNNVYPATIRAQGVDGFDALFAEQMVWGKYNTPLRRDASCPSHFTTDPQAEVLYPGAVDLTHLRALYVADPEHVDQVAGYVAAINGASPVDLSGVAISTNTGVFA